VFLFYDFFVTLLLRRPSAAKLVFMVVVTHLCLNSSSTTGRLIGAQQVSDSEQPVRHELSAASKK
jgi:hypothetical protein